jgi:hypothetical protein
LEIFSLGDVEFLLVMVFERGIVEHFLRDFSTVEEPDTADVEVGFVTVDAVSTESFLSGTLASLDETVLHVVELEENSAFTFVLLVVNVVDAVLSGLEVFNEVLDGFFFILSVSVEGLVVIKIPGRLNGFFLLFFFLGFLFFLLSGFLLGGFLLGSLLFLGSVLFLLVFLLFLSGEFVFSGGEMDLSPVFSELRDGGNSVEVSNEVSEGLSLFFGETNSESEDEDGSEVDISDGNGGTSEERRSLDSFVEGLEDNGGFVSGVVQDGLFSLSESEVREEQSEKRREELRSVSIEVLVNEASFEVGSTVEFARGSSNVSKDSGGLIDGTFSSLDNRDLSERVLLEELRGLSLAVFSLDEFDGDTSELTSDEDGVNTEVTGGGVELNRHL